MIFHRKIQKNKILIWLWSKIYSRWLRYERYEGQMEIAEVLAVLGWRTMRVSKYHQTQTITPCFLWFK
jgi:hypothetical protein